MGAPAHISGAILLGAVALLGCSGGSDAPAAAPLPADAWIAQVASQPESFAQLLERTGREGWIALHANDLPQAVAAFAGSDPERARARARAELTLGVLHEDLARLSWVAHERLFEAWERRGGVPNDTSAPVVAALAARCAEQPWKPWADRATGPGATFLATLSEPEALWPAEVPAALLGDPVAARRVLHAKARAGDVAALQAAAAEPLLVDLEDGFERRFYDPCLHHTLATAWTTRALTSLGAPEADWREAASVWAAPDAGLGSLLFAPVLTTADLASEVREARAPGLIGATMPSLDALGVARKPAATDEIDVARDEARLVGEALDRWRAELLASANEEGRAVLTDLELVARFRQDWLVRRARLALLDHRPRQALAYVQLARDVADPAIGPSNSASLYALLAEAELRNGRTREALDALQLLHERHPEVLGLREVVGDLAVLEGLDRRGDSKEN